MTATKSRARKTVSPAERERRAEAHKAKAEALQAGLAARVDALATSADYLRYLDHARSFHRYSFSNLMLIWSQHPSATRVAGFNQWQERGRQVRKGEKAISIYGYAVRKRTETDPATGLDVERRQVWYPILSVFAEDQTEPITEVPEWMAKKNPKARVWDPAQDAHPARLLAGEDTDGLAARVRDLIEGMGWSYSREPIAGPANGYATMDGSRAIVVDSALEPAMAAKTLCHEMFHSLMHADESGLLAADAPQERALQELEAESAAYVLCGILGLDSAQYSIGYLSSWSKGDVELIHRTAERVLGAVQRVVAMLDDLDEEIVA